MNFRRIADLFESALGRPEGERRAWLSSACPEEPEVRKKVEAMLTAHERKDGGILDRSIDEVARSVLGPSRDARIDRRVGPYRLEAEIGRGGMGVVYRAFDPRLSRRLAIKFLPRRPDESAKARFMAEARAASALDHPNICTIYDIGESEDGELYIAMAYYGGATLAERIERGPLAVPEALEIARRIADGLGRAHEAGIVHRDIKPSNIVLTERGDPKILDFGVAKLEGDAGLTDPGAVVGTPAYMSPEQLRGAEPGPHTDLWSLGVLLYEMIAGRRPFTGDRISVLHSILHEEPPDLARLRPEVPEAVDLILHRLLAKRPDERYADADELIADLESARRVLAGESDDRSASIAVAARDLPVSLTSFVGRERELEQIGHLLRTARLVTLTGPAGTGKTRLAVRAAEAVADDLTGGVFFVSLSAVQDPERVPATIAQTLGLPESASTHDVDRLKAFLRARSVLLVLDNFEQVSDAAPVVGELLAECPDLRVLTTSRVALRVSGEREYPVAPLALPERAALSDIDAIQGSAAIQLFIDRAQAVKPDFALTSQNARAVADLCIRLDGLPLAIELAAARIKLFPPEAMLDRIGSRLDLLKGGPRDRPARHQTLRQAIAWSYDLLSEDEQAVFRRLSVFIGGFTPEAAEAVVAAGEPIELDPIDGLASLVDHSLIRQQETPGGAPRFEMLETIRAYAHACLSEARETEAVERAHTEHYRELAERAEPELIGAHQAAWLDRMETEHDNLRAVLGRAESGTGLEALEAGLRIAAAIWRFWLSRGHVGEGRQRLETLIGRAGDEVPAELVARALHGLGTLTHNMGDNVQARAQLEESLAIWRRLDDRRGLATALNNLAWVACEISDLDRARSLAEEGLALNRELGETRGIAVALNNLGWIANYRGDYRSARSHHEEQLALRRQLGDQRNIAFALTSLAWAEEYHGNYERAERLLDDALSVLRQVKDKLLIGFALFIRAQLLYDRGDLEAAADLVQESLPRWRKGGNRSGVGWALALQGLVEAHRGELDRAESLLKQGLEIWGEVGGRWASATAILGLGRIAATRGDEREAMARYRESLAIRRTIGDRRGSAQCLESIARILADREDPEAAVRILAVADRTRAETEAPVPARERADHEALLDRLETALGPADFERAWSAGRELTLAELSEAAGIEL